MVLTLTMLRARGEEVWLGFNVVIQNAFVHTYVGAK